MIFYKVVVIIFFITSQNLFAQDMWSRVEYSSKNYSTGLKFFSGERQVGGYSDPEGRFLIQENKSKFHTIDTENHSKSIITAWMKGSKTHAILVFNNQVSSSSPICSLPAWGDPLFIHKVEDHKLYLKIKESQTKPDAWKLCYDFKK